MGEEKNTPAIRGPAFFAERSRPERKVTSYRLRVMVKNALPMTYHL